MKLKRTPPRQRKHNEAWGGSFFVTFNVNERDRSNPRADGPLGTVRANSVDLSPLGKIVEEVWQELPILFRSIELGDHIVMPDHFHGVIHLRPAMLGNNTSFKSLGRTIGALKSISAKRINELQGTIGKTFWQRGLYDRIIRDDKIHARVRTYIKNNPVALHRRVLAYARDYSSGGLQSATTIVPGEGKSGS